MLARMSKTLLYSLAALADFAIAIFAYHSGRIVIPIVLVFAGICFTMAAIGAARGSGSSK